MVSFMFRLGRNNHKNETILATTTSQVVVEALHRVAVLGPNFLKRRDNRITGMKTRKHGVLGFLL